MQNTKFYALFSIMVLVLASCSKNGSPGPQGPAGNANVKVDTFVLTNSSWLWAGSYSFSTSAGGYTSYPTRYCDIASARLTQGILDSGMVMVYFRPFEFSTTQWAPLPYSFLSYNYQFYYNFVYETLPGKLRLHYLYTPNGAGGTAPFGTLKTDLVGTHTFKIVIVSGTITADMRRQLAVKGSITL